MVALDLPRVVKAAFVDLKEPAEVGGRIDADDAVGAGAGGSIRTSDGSERQRKP